MLIQNFNLQILEYLKRYPYLNSFLYFNSAEETPGNCSIQTISSDVWEKKYIYNHGIKVYDFAVILFKNQDFGTNSNNADEMFDIQKFMLWIDEQNKNKNFPEFKDAKVISIENLQNMPNLAGINQDGNLAKYIFQIRIKYYI